MTYENPWLWNGIAFESEHIEDHVGFVYQITNLVSGKKYIGKKWLWSVRKKAKAKRRVKSESDWKKYYGSNAELKNDIEQLGKDNFKREILRLCMTKGECSYYEAKEQFDKDVLLSEGYYNVFLGCRINKKHLIKGT